MLVASDRHAKPTFRGRVALGVWQFFESQDQRAHRAEVPGSAIAQRSVRASVVDRLLLPIHRAAYCSAHQFIQLEPYEFREPPGTALHDLERSACSAYSL